MFILLGFLIAAAAALYIALPLLEPAGSDAGGAGDALLDDLVAQRNTLYREIADLDFDHRAGKIGDADYGVQRTEYVDEAAVLLERIDAEIDVRSSASGVADDATTEAGAEIEAEVRRLRGLRTSSS